MKILAIDTATKLGNAEVPAILLFFIALDVQCLQARRFQERYQRVENKYANVMFAQKSHIYTD